LGYFMTLWYIFGSFGTFFVHLVHFLGLSNIYQEKSGNPGSGKRRQRFFINCDRRQTRVARSFLV
jgi:hypothetical protein